MTQRELNVVKLEKDLRQQARNYLAAIDRGQMQPHNAESILVRLTGCKFKELVLAHQIQQATSKVEVALLRERKKARLKHYDYDLNRHIALHQAKNSLKQMRETSLQN